MQNQALEMTQKTALRLSQQQLRFVRLLELNAPELDEAVERELEDNPALGIDDGEGSADTPGAAAGYTSWRRPAPPEDWAFSPADETSTLYDQLLEQLSERDLGVNVETAARFIIGSLDSNGYLHRTLHEIIDDLAFGPGLEVTREEAEEALRTVRSLDPPGIGASDLRDCLRMQLEAMPPGQVRDNALRIIDEAYEAFTMKHRHRIVSSLRLTPPEADSALDLILSLNPKPGAALGHDPSAGANVIIPDFTVNNEDGRLTISLNNSIPELRIEQSFEEAVRGMERNGRLRPVKGSEFIVSRYNDARDFIRILAQRQQTMMDVMTAIVEIQREYFLTEDIYRLRPMIIKNVAERTGLDISTVSRVTSNKYVALPWGVLPLRFFFSDQIGDDGEGTDAATNRKVEAAIAALVAAEDKRRPLSDRKIMEEMLAAGYDLSRRTVAKYRDRQGIPVARLRKQL